MASSTNLVDYIAGLFSAFFSVFFLQGPYQRSWWYFKLQSCPSLLPSSPQWFASSWNVSNIREVKHHVYVKQQTRIGATWPSFSIACRLLFIISTHKLVVSGNSLSIRIVLSSFFLLIFYFEKFSTWIWRLPSAVSWSLNSILFFIPHNFLSDPRYIDFN